MAAVLRAIALISEPPGSYLYQGFLLCVLAVIAVRAAAVGARRLTLAFAGLAGLRLGALIIGLLTNRLPLYQLVIIPPFDRAVTCLTIFGLIWALTYPHTSRLAYSLAGAVTLLTTAAVVGSWLLWVDAVGRGSVFYNGTLQDSWWLIAQIFLLAAGLFTLARTRPAGWQAGAGLLAVLLAGEALHYFFPIADANVPGFVRFAELIVWPLAAIVLWRRPLAAPAAALPRAEPAAAPLAVAEPVRSPAGTIEAELESANRRNQQLRETNRKTREQLAAAEAALAEHQARLAEAAQARDTGAAEAAGRDEAARAELARERSARDEAEAAARGLEARLAALEAALQTAGDAAAEAARTSEELAAARDEAKSQAQMAAHASSQLAAALADVKVQSMARQAAESQLATLEAALLAAGDKSSQAEILAQELNAVRQVAQSQSELVARLGEQLAESQAELEAAAQARQAAETRLAEAEQTGETLKAEREQQAQAEARLQAELHDSQTALAEARRTSDRAQAQLAEQAIQVGVLQQQVAQLERAAQERNGQVERRRPAASAAPKTEGAPARAPRQPKNGTNGQPSTPAAAGANGQNGNGAAHPAAERPNLLAAELKPELTPTIAGPVCAKLGLQTDRATRHAFPSDANRCFGLGAPAEVSFEQQRTYCLSGAHAACPVFTGQLLNPILPIDTSPAPPPEPRPAKGLGQRMGRFFRRQS